MGTDYWRYSEKNPERVLTILQGQIPPIQTIPLDFEMNDKLFYICRRKAVIYSQSF
jgi:hypothetical protein